MNGADIIVIIAVTALVALAFFIMRRKRKYGKRGCGCECTDCARNCGKNTK